MKTTPLPDRPRFSRQSHLDDANKLRPGLRAALASHHGVLATMAPAPGLAPVFESGRNALFDLRRAFSQLGDDAPPDANAHLQKLEQELIGLDMGTQNGRMNLLDFQVQRITRRLGAPHVGAKKDPVAGAMDAISKVQEQVGLVEDPAVRHTLDKKLDFIRTSVRARFGLVGG
ncbi:MAG: hypothetical protein RMA76_44790 [Deltaproteobacteria bacterium]|jgi:hypothetical protein